MKIALGIMVLCYGLGLAACDGLTNAVDGAIHAEHRVGIEKVLDARVEKFVGFGGGLDSSSQQ